MKKQYLVLVWIIVLAGVFSLGFVSGQFNQSSVDKAVGLDNKQLGQPAEVDFSLFWDTWHVVESKFVDRDKLDRQKMVYGAISGMVSALGDPHSVFMEPETSKKFLDDINGSFSGIGAEVGIRGGILTVISPLEGSPAQKAGLKAKDRIFEVDGEPTADSSLDESVSRIRGDKGTEVKLLVGRDDWEELKEIKIIRDEIRVPIVKWERKDGDILYVQIFHFTESLSNEFERVMNETSSQFTPKGVVLDLRNNPGGYLEVAVDISSWFLPKGELIVTEDFGNGEENNEFRSQGFELFEKTPVVVLMNEGSASASEIVAGALRDIRQAEIVGRQSFGKGSVQQLEKLRGGASVKITVAKWLTPSGVSINDEGIKPSYDIELKEEDVEKMQDTQLDKALEVIRGIITR